MKSKGIENSQERIVKATESLWKFLWFLVYIIFIPTLVAVLFFFLFGFIVTTIFGVSDFVIPLALSAIMFLVSILIFYRPFDKYRNKSIFQNKINNPRVRIHILFLITLISLIYTPVFLLFVPQYYQDQLNLLPLITFALTYNSIYLYFFSQPIDFFSISDSSFKHFNRFKDTIKQPYNLIILMNYAVHIAFLSFTFEMQLLNINISWSFAFITNLLFYIIALRTTKPYVKKIEYAISNQGGFLEDLVLYKQAFVKSIVRMDFLILIQIPFGILSVFFRSIGPNSLINAFFITIILLIFNFKIDIYLKSYYFNQLNRLNPEKYPSRELGVKWNFFLTVLIMILIPSYIFYYSFSIPEVLYFNFLALVIIFTIIRVEEKYKYLPKSYARHLHLINTIFLLAIISFQILSVLDPFIQFAIFLISLYFGLEIFTKYEYYSKKNVLIVQNILAISGFYCIAYIFFKEIAFGTTPIDSINNFMVHYILPGLIGSLFSLYLLYFRHFYNKSWKTLRTGFIINFLAIIGLAFYLFNLNFDFNTMVAYVIGFSILYITFSGFNYIIQLFTKENLVNNVYNTIWLLDFSVFTVLLVNTLKSGVTLFTIIPDFFILSILILFTVWFGKKVGRLSEDTYFKLFNLNGFLLIIEIFILSSQYLIEKVFLDEIEFKILAYFLSTCIISLIINIAAPSKSPLIKKVKDFLNIFTVMFGWFVLEMFYFLANYQNLYFLYGLIIFSSIVTTLPIGFLVIAKLIDKKKFVDYLYLVLNAICLTSFSFIIHFILLTNIVDLFFGFNFILLSLIICYIGIGKLGVKFGYVSEEFYIKFVKLMYYPIGILLFLVFFSFTLSTIGDAFLSFLIASLILSAMTNFASLSFKTINLINLRITSFTLFYAAIYMSIFLFQSFIIIPFSTLSLSEWYVNLYASVMSIQVIFYIPFGYLAAKKVIKREVYYRYSYYSMFSLMLLLFLFIVSFFYNLFYSSIVFYILAFIADLIYITITLYNHIKRGLAKKYLPTIHLTRKSAIILYTTLFTEFYAFLLTIILLFFPQPLQLWQMWFSSYFAFILITLVIMALASKLIIFSTDFSRRINLISLIFTSVTFSYFILNLVNNIFNNLFLQWDITIISFLTFLLLPLYHSIKRKMFQRFLSKKYIYINGILILLSIIALPALFAYEFSLFENYLPYIIISSIVLVYCFLKYLEYTFDELKVGQGRIIALKTIQLISWNLLSIIASNTIFITFAPMFIDQLFYMVLMSSFITFFIINLNSLTIIEDIKQRVFENEDLKIDYYKVYKIYEFYKNISFFAFIFSISGLISAFLSPISYIFEDLIPLLFLSPEIIQFEMFFLLTLLILLITQKIEIEYQKIRTWITLISWVIIKGTICVYMYFYFIDTPIIAWSISILIFSVLSPITMNFIKNIRLIFGTTNKIINSTLVSSFYISLITLYLLYFWNLRISPFFAENLLLFWFLLISNAIIYFDYVFIRLKDVFEANFEFNLLKLYFKSALVLFLFIFIDFYLNLILWFIAAIVLLNRRNHSIIIRWVIYMLFTLSLYIYITIDFSILLTLGGRYLYIILSGSLLSVLFISILTNYEKVNDIEKFSVYLILSFLSFIAFSLIPGFFVIPGLLYNGTFSLLIFLVLTGNHYYQKRDNRYKLFIRPCVVLAVFDFTSFIFYGILFNNTPYSPVYQSILSFTSTFSLTGFAFVSLYNQSPQRFRRLSFFIILPLLILNVPIFVYYFTYATFPLLRTSMLPLTISLNIGIFFFFIAIGLYQWKFSRAIWKTGFWAWILFPIINYAVIDQSLANLSLRTLELFGFINIPASTLLAITICIILSFPFWYTWIRAHFTTVLFAAWILNLGLLYWFSQSLFFGSELLINSSFLIFSFILLMPLVYKLKIWRVLMAFWILFTIITISFIDFTFISMGFDSTTVLSIDISVIGLSLIFLSYFPNMRNKRNLSLIIAYFTLITGISIMVYQIILIATVFRGDPIGALYSTVIIISASSFSSRILKINKILMNFLISWALVISFALMSFHIYSKLFPYNIGAFYIALSVGGLTFFIFNRYKMLWGSYENFMPVSSIIAFIAISLGTSLSISSILLYYLIFENPWFLTISVFLFTNIIILSFKLKIYQFILAYLLPIPITSLILHLLVLFNPLINALILSIIGIFIFSFLNQFMKVNITFKAILRLILYLDSFVLSLLLSNIPDPSLNLFISLLILFVLTFFENLLLKKRKYWFNVLLNLVSYVSSTVFLYWYLNGIFLEQFDYIIWLNTFIFILLQKYTVYISYTILKSLNKYDLEKLIRYKSILNFILSNSLYFLISLYGSLSLGSVISVIFSLVETASIFLGLTLFCLFYFILISFFNRKLKGNIRNLTRMSLFLAFQGNLFGFWAFSLGLSDLFYLMCILIIETILIYCTFSLISLSIKKEGKERVLNYAPPLTYLLYVEISILSFAWFNILALYQLYSSILTILVFFILTVIDLGIVKKVNIKLMKLSHFLSYTTLSMFIFIQAFDFLFGQVNTIIFNFIIIFFLAMQFYTIRSLFSFLSHYQWFNNNKALRIKQMINNILINSIFVLLSLLGTQLVTDYLFQFNNLYFYLLSFSFFIFFLNGTVNRTIEKSLRVKYLLVPSFIAMQVFSLGLMVNIMILSDINLYIFWLSLIALVETVLSVYPLNIVRNYTMNEARKLLISRLFKVVDFCLYLEITMLSFGLFYFNLNQDPFQSLLYSQLVLFGLSILEIVTFKRLKEKFGHVIHLLSYLIISASLIYIIFMLSLSEILYLIVILMQFYSNFVYYRMKRDINPTKAETYQQGAVRRQKIIGNAFYIVLVFLVSRFLLVFSGYNILTSFFLINLLLHLISLLDRAILIFLGRLSMPLIVISLIFINFFSIPSLLTFIFSTGLTYTLIPLVILIVELELFYLTKVTSKWQTFRSLIISILYFNISSWPIYFVNSEVTFLTILINFNLILLSLFLLFIMAKIDKQINALNIKISNGITSTALVILGFGVPIDIFILLQSYLPAQFPLNFAFSALIGTIELGIIKKPYKKKRSISFFYTLSLLIELLVITNQLSIPALGYSILVLGTLIYLYTFLLEELKEFFSHIVDYISKGFKAVKSFIYSILNSIYNFLRRNYITLKILLAATIGSLLGYVSSIVPIFLPVALSVINPPHAPLFGLAVFGLIVGLFPGTKSEDPDIIFRTRMIRFSTVWFGITIVIVTLILPIISDDIILQAFFVLSSFVILGLILAIYVWRIEKKQKISIKWRFYITITLIVMLVIWGILIFMLYLGFS